MAEYNRVPVGKDQPLGPGLYEAVLSISGNPRPLQKADLQRLMASRFGDRVEVIDWTQTGNDYRLQFRVKGTTQAATRSDIVPAFLPIVITIAAIAGALYLAYRITVEIKSAVALIPAPARGIAVSGAGIGVAGLGVGAALLALWLWRH